MAKHYLASVSILLFLLHAASLSAQWTGLTDASVALQTSRFTFGSLATEGPGNENYYDGDFGDFNGDGLVDRLLGARYGLLINRGEGWMDFFAGRTNFQFRGTSSAGINGEDAFNWSDIDNDGDLDAISGGQSGETLAIQENNRGRFSVKTLSLGAQTGVTASATAIANTDVNRDGFVDLIATFGFEGDPPTMRFNLFLNVETDPIAGTRDFVRVDPLTNGLNRYTGQQYGCSGVATADVDMDGDYDLILQQGHASIASNRFLVVAKNNGSGLFSFTQTTDVPRPGTGFSTPLSMGDVDGDGDIDFVMIGGPTTSGSHAVVHHSIAINDGTGNFRDEADLRFTGNYTGDTSQWGPAEGGLLDVDYDGDLDIVASAGSSGASGYLTVFLNNGSGYFTHYQSLVPSGTINGIGNDTDFTDIDGDGTYDVWIGRGGDFPHVFLNGFTSPDGLPADMPRNFTITAVETSGITLRWNHPAFACNTRHYRVFRSSSPDTELRDRQLIKIVGERHQDEKFCAPITRHMTTSYLNDPDVTLDGANNSVDFKDTTALPGVTYYYSLVHVGAQNSSSKPSPEVSATIPPAGGADVVAPTLTIVGPTRQDWDQYPRIVLTYGDGGSGVDLNTLNVSFNQPLGDGTPAGTNLAGSFHRKDANTYVCALTPPRSVPVNLVATMTASISDLSGNVATKQVAFFPSVAASPPGNASYPTSAYTAGATTGDAPLSPVLDGSTSQDNGVGSYPKDAIFAWEWYFSDGTTATGRKVIKTFDSGGNFTATLLIRDNDGSVHTASKSFTVMSNYAAFVSKHFTPAEQADPTIFGEDANPDGDLLKNALEFALHKNPKAPDTEGIGMVRTGNQIMFSYDKVANAPDLDWQWYHATNDLSDWQPITPISEVPTADHGDYLEMETTFDITNPDESFYRLKIDQD